MTQTVADDFGFLMLTQTVADDFGFLLWDMYRASRPDGRVSDHLLKWEIHEAVRFAQQHPDAVTALVAT